MKQGRALPEVLKELQHQNNMKQDFIGPAQAFMLEPDGRTFRIRHQNTGAERRRMKQCNIQYLLIKHQQKGW